MQVVLPFLIRHSPDPSSRTQARRGSLKFPRVYAVTDPKQQRHRCQFPSTRTIACGIFYLFSELLAFSDHPVNFFLTKPRLVVGDGDGLGFPAKATTSQSSVSLGSCTWDHSRSLVHCRYLQDTIRIDLEGDLDLWDSAGSGGYATQVKLP